MKSYLKFLSRNKLYTAIEFVGLAVSLAFVIIIGSYVWQQFAVTRENPNRENIYLPGMPGCPGLTYAFPDVITEIPEIEKPRCAVLSFEYHCDGILRQEKGSFARGQTGS